MTSFTFLLCILLFSTLFAPPFTAAQPQHAFTQPAATPSIKKVAIIGAGAGGSSAAYWLRGAFPPGNAAGIELSTTVYEKSSKAGGRSTVLDVAGDPDLRIELGASIFVDANWNLMNATQRFNLTLKPFKSEASSLGIWDGKQFVFEESAWSWWDITKVLWRYGYTTPVRVRTAVSEAVEKFQKAYDYADFPPFNSIGGFVRRAGFVNETGRTAEDYFIKDHELYAPYITEIIQSATRANYVQNTDSIHALGALVSMAASGALSVEGGNYQIFEQFLERSGARLRFNTAVAEIRRLDLGDPEPKYVVVTSDGQREVYDSVVLAAPIHSCGIELEFGHNKNPKFPPIYQPLYVTVIVGEPDSQFFDRASLAKMPTIVITTPVNASSPEDEPEQPSFISFAIHNDNVTTFEDGNPINGVLVKMFSDARVPDSVIAQMFQTVAWRKGKAWEAFPVLGPIYVDDELEGEDFVDMEEDVMVEMNGKNRPMPIRLDNREFYYVNAFESVVSTMETETLASKNIVRLLHKKWCNGCEKFGDGWGWEDEDEDEDEDEVVGCEM